MRTENKMTAVRNRKSGRFADTHKIIRGILDVSGTWVGRKDNADIAQKSAMYL